MKENLTAKNSIIINAPIAKVWDALVNLQMTMKAKTFLIIGITLILSNTSFAQEKHITQFAIWKPKEGKEQLFENGYKAHLKWHEANGDTWSWWGWYVISGPRYGYFVDATADHSWADFDAAVKPAEDIADNRLHVFPFGELQTVYKVSEYEKASTNDSFNLKTKLARHITLTVNSMDNALKAIEKVKDFYVSQNIKTFKTFTVIDGGNLNQIIIIMGFDSWAEYSMSEKFQEKLSEIERSLKQNSILSCISETLAYRADMSWFPSKK
jgi:hypothetical protein